MVSSQVDRKIPLDSLVQEIQTELSQEAQGL
jgi:hypothetical protein